jgi:hypothetical protein
MCNIFISFNGTYIIFEIQFILDICYEGTEAKKTFNLFVKMHFLLKRRQHSKQIPTNNLVNSSNTMYNKWDKSKTLYQRQ